MYDFVKFVTLKKMLKRIFENVLTLLFTKSILDWQSKRKRNTKLSKKEEIEIEGEFNKVNETWNSYSKYK